MQEKSSIGVDVTSYGAYDGGLKIAAEVVDGFGEVEDTEEFGKGSDEEEGGCDSKVLVHCHEGKSRSVMLLLAYIMTVRMGLGGWMCSAFSGKTG